MVDVSIILINYNTLKYTLQCIESIYKHSSGFTLEIIVIDNASEDFDPNNLISQFPNVKIITNDLNLGFAKANNQGIEISKGEYILLLNNDTELIQNSILICLNFLRQNPDIAVVSPKIMYPDGRIQHVVNSFPSILSEFIELTRLTKLLSAQFLAKKLKGRYFDHEKSIESDWVWGTFFMFKKEKLKLLEGNKLNECFFLYYEDVLWCYEFKEAGSKTYYLADTSIVHHGSKSSELVNHSKFNSIILNERAFLKMKKGLAYYIVFAFFKSLVFLSQKAPHLRSIGFKYLLSLKHTVL